MTERKPKGIVVQAAVEWNFLQQRVHHLSRALADLDCQVVFVENIGVRRPKLRDWRRVAQKLWRAAGSRPRAGDEAVHVCSPLALSGAQTGFLVDWSARMVSARIEDEMRRWGFTPGECLYLSYIANPTTVRMAKQYPWYRVVYDVVSDPKLVEPKVARWEPGLLRRADAVLFASESLRTHYEATYPDIVRKTHVLHDGYTVRNRAAAEGTAAATPLGGFSRPRIVYVGGINHRVRWDVIEELCRHFPGGNVVLFGERSAEPPRPFPNMHLIPALKDYAQVIGALEQADVCIIPYQDDLYTGLMRPAKLNEYLLAGKPIVSLATSEMRRFAAESRPGVVYLAEDPKDFCRQVEEALAADGPSLATARRGIARRRPWSLVGEEFLALVVPPAGPNT